MLLSYQKKRRMFLGTGLKEFRFVDYARRILSKTSATAAPDLYVMAPSGVSPIIKALASEFNVNVHSLEDFIGEDFQGSYTVADRIQCASSSVFMATKSSFSNSLIPYKSH